MIKAAQSTACRRQIENALRLERIVNIGYIPSRRYESKGSKND